jgi:hypothetical protein
MRALLMSCRGFLVFSGGQYKLRIDRDETIPGAYWGYDFSDGEARQFAGGTGLPLACTRAGATGTAFDSSGTLQVIAANTLRLDFNPSTLAANGLLIEEARANGIRNNVAAGAVAGSPGTQPTNWNMTTTGGVVTRTIVGVGVENGIDYIDVRYQFSAAGTVNVIPEGSTTIVAANGQTWAASSFLRVVGGSLANLVARMAITGHDNTGVQTEATTTNCTPVPTGAGLATQRYAAVRTFNVAGTVFSLGFLQLIASAAADVTVRVGLQQTERCTVGGSMSSVIRTTGAAATRNIDRPSFAVPATLNTSEGSVVIAWKAADDPAGVAARVFYIGDGTDNERIMLYVDHSADRVNLQVVDGGVTQASINLGAHVAGSVNTAAISWKANDISGSLNGAAAITDTAASIPTLTQFDLGHQNGANSLNGDVLDVAYIRRALSDSELVSQSGSPFVLDEDNIIGSWQIQLGNKHNRFNRVKARFFNEASGFNPDLAVWPTVDPITGEDPVGDAYRALDGGIVLETVADLPFTTDLYRAQQICQVELKRSRFNLTVSLVATIDATRLEVGDVVPVSHATPGWPAAGDPAEGKLFRVIEIELLNNDEVRLVLLEYNAAVYDLDDVHQVVQAQLTSLPDATSTVSPGTPSVAETLYETTGSAGVKSRATVTWGAAADVWVVRGGYYELEYKLTADTTWARISPLSDPMVVIPDLAAGRYDFRVRAVNVLGTHSAYSATTTKELFGLTTPPSDPANFAAQAYADHIKFTWDRPTSNTDLDVVQGGRAFIRWSPRTSGATWNDGSLVNFDGYAPDGTDARGPLQTGTYFLKFRDSSGNYSVNAASFVVTEALLTGLSTLATITESPTFTGAKTSVVALDGVLKLDGTILWDSIPGNIDDWGYVDSSGVLASSGSYAFASKMDLGSVKNFRLFATIRSLAFDTADNWDARINNIDDWGTIDGDVVEDAEATLLVRVTNDDPNATPTWGPWHRLGFVADYNARGCDFRLDFVTATVTHNRQVDQLVVTAKQ